MKNLITSLVLILFFGIIQTSVAQDDNLSAVIKFKPVKNSTTLSSKFSENVYRGIIKSLDTKNRFVAFAEGADEPTDVAATILAELSIKNFTSSNETVRAKKPKDAGADWKAPAPQIVTKANIGGEITLTDIATGEKLEPKYFQGAYENSMTASQLERAKSSYYFRQKVYNDRRKEGEPEDKDKYNWKRIATKATITDVIKNWNRGITYLIPIEVKIKSIAEAKKNKAVRLMLDAGKNKDVEVGDAYDVVELTSYEVGGKKLNKETKIGSVWVGKKKYIMENESSFKVRKGKKKIFEAINADKDLALKLR